MTRNESAAAPSRASNCLEPILILAISSRVDAQGGRQAAGQRGQWIFEKVHAGRVSSSVAPRGRGSSASQLAAQRIRLPARPISRTRRRSFPRCRPGEGRPISPAWKAKAKGQRIDSNPDASPGATLFLIDAFAFAIAIAISISTDGTVAIGPSEEDDHRQSSSPLDGCSERTLDPGASVCAAAFW